MNWLYETSPWVWLAIGGIALAVLVGGWIQTGRRELLYGVPAVVLLAALAAAVALWTETPAKQVRATLLEIADRVERNDIEGALEYLHPSAAGARALARSELPRYEMQRVRISRNLEIEVDEEQPPSWAVARFNVVVVARDRGLGSRHTYPRFVIVEFVHENDGWLVRHYEHHDPRRGQQRDGPQF